MRAGVSIRHRVGAVAAIWLASTAPSIAQGTITRDEVVQRLGDRLSLAGELSARLGEAESASLLQWARLEIDKQAGELLPISMTGHSESAIEGAIGNVILRFSDREHIALLVHKHLLDIRMTLEFQQQVRDLSGAERESLERRVNALVEAMKESMNEQWGEWFDPTEVESHLSLFRDNLLRAMDDPNTYAMKVPMDESAIDALIEEFTLRLSEQRGALASEVQAAGDVGEAGLRRIESLKQSRLMSATSETMGRLFDLTSDPALAAVDPETAAPGYRDVIDRMMTLEQRLLDERLSEIKAMSPQEVVEWIKSGRAEMEFPQDRFRENLSPSQTNVGDLSGDRPERLTPPLTTYDSRPPAADHPMDLSNSFTHRLILRIILIVAASILVAALAWARVRKS